MAEGGGLFDRWARREQNRAMAENAAEIARRDQQRERLEWSGVAVCAVVGALLPLAVWITLFALALIAGPGRRWLRRRRRAR
jgi:hypothetical protein